MVGKRQFGFTLLEVMIALVIISLAFAALITSINANARSLLHIENTAAAVWVASNVMSEAELGLLGEVNSGVDDQLNRRYYWKIIKKTTENPGVMNISVQVSVSPNKGPFLTLNGFLGVGNAPPPS